MSEDITNKELAGKIDQLVDITQGLDKKIDGVNVSLSERIDNVNKSLSQRIDDLAMATAKGFQNVDERFERVEGRLDKVENRLGTVEETVSRIESRQTGQQNEIDDLRDRVKIVETKVAA